MGCHRLGTPLCWPCLQQQEPATGPGRCLNCAAQWNEPDSFCPRCTGWRNLDGGASAFEHTGAVARAVHALKYGRQRVIAPAMAATMVLPITHGPLSHAEPIPLHTSRRKDRGFNQAELLSRRLGLPPLPGRLLRVRKTRTQVGMSFAQRRQNVAGAFAYEGEELEGANIALVDDVVTTGATADECAAVLKDHGAASVVVVSFTRASYQTRGAGPISV